MKTRTHTHRRLTRRVGYGMRTLECLCVGFIKTCSCAHRDYRILPSAFSLPNKYAQQPGAQLSSGPQTGRPAARPQLCKQMTRNITGSVRGTQTRTIPSSHRRRRHRRPKTRKACTPFGGRHHRGRMQFCKFINNNNTKCSQAKRTHGQRTYRINPHICRDAHAKQPRTPKCSHNAHASIHTRWTNTANRADGCLHSCARTCEHDAHTYYWA